MIKAVLIEDEQLFRKDIAQLLDGNFGKQIELVGSGYNVASGVKEIELRQPDLVLLDVNLGDGTGFDLLNQLENQDFALIFVTGFDNHAIKAIKIGALDYIMKPIDEDEFIESIEKAIISIQSRNKVIIGSRDIAAQYYSGKSLNNFVVSTNEATHVLRQDEIYYCSSEGNYTTFHTKEGNVLASRPLKYYEDIFEKSRFIRCHRSYVVNKEHITRYDKTGSLILSNGEEVPVSFRKKNQVLEILKA